jgi:hypothetical protein
MYRTTCGACPNFCVQGLEYSAEFTHLLPTLLALDSYPFTKLRLAVGEAARWKAHHPTFHRGTSVNVGVKLTHKPSSATE